MLSHLVRNFLYDALISAASAVLFLQPFPFFGAWLFPALSTFRFMWDISKSSLYSAFQLRWIPFFALSQLFLCIYLLFILHRTIIVPKYIFICTSIFRWISQITFQPLYHLLVALGIFTHCAVWTLLPLLSVCLVELLLFSNLRLFTSSQNLRRLHRWPLRSRRWPWLPTRWVPSHFFGPRWTVWADDCIYSIALADVSRKLFWFNLFQTIALENLNLIDSETERVDLLLDSGDSKQAWL